MDNFGEILIKWYQDNKRDLPLAQDEESLFNMDFGNYIATDARRSKVMITINVL